MMMYHHHHHNIINNNNNNQLQVKQVQIVLEVMLVLLKKKKMMIYQWNLKKISKGKNKAKIYNNRYNRYSRYRYICVWDDTDVLEWYKMLEYGFKLSVDKCKDDICGVLFKLWCFVYPCAKHEITVMIKSVCFLSIYLANVMWLSINLENTKNTKNIQYYRFFCLYLNVFLLEQRVKFNNT